MSLLNASNRTLLVNALLKDLDASSRTPSDDDITDAFFNAGKTCYLTLLPAALRMRNINSTHAQISSVQSYFDECRAVISTWSTSEFAQFFKVANPSQQIRIPVPPVLDADAKDALWGLVLGPWMLMYFIQSLSNSPMLSVKNQIMVRYIFIKAAANVLTQLADTYTDSSRAPLDAVIQAIAMDVNSVMTSAPFTADRAHAAMVANKQRAVEIDFQNYVVAMRTDRTADTQVSYQVLQANVISQRREFMVWALAYVTLLLCAVYLLMTNNMAAFVLVGTSQALLMTLVLLGGYLVRRFL